jgi:hypothetical protein
MAEAELNEAAKAELEAGRATRAKAMEDFAARTKGKPTPTQAENDEATLGKYFAEHEADGGDPDPQGSVGKQLEAKPGGGYQTRQATITRPAAAPAKPTS